MFFWLPAIFMLVGLCVCLKKEYELYLLKQRVLRDYSKELEDRPYICSPSEARYVQNLLDEATNKGEGK